MGDGASLFRYTESKYFSLACDIARDSDSAVSKVVGMYEEIDTLRQQLSEVERERKKLSIKAINLELDNQALLDLAYQLPPEVFERNKPTGGESALWIEVCAEQTSRAEKAEAEKEAIWQRCIEIAGTIDPDDKPLEESGYLEMDYIDGMFDESKFICNAIRAEKEKS